MEIGAVIGAAPAQNVRREAPAPGDVVLLLGGRTGRDGCGGATGSSKSHTAQSLTTCGAEVQKGNAPEERKLQRLFRDPQAARMIKRCNDFGARRRFRRYRRTCGRSGRLTSIACRASTRDSTALSSPFLSRRSAWRWCSRRRT